MYMPVDMCLYKPEPLYAVFWVVCAARMVAYVAHEFVLYLKIFML